MTPKFNGARQQPLSTTIVRNTSWAGQHLLLSSSDIPGLTSVSFGFVNRFLEFSSSMFLGKHRFCRRLNVPNPSGFRQNVYLANEYGTEKIEIPYQASVEGDRKKKRY